MDSVISRMEILKNLLKSITGEMDMLREENARVIEENVLLKKKNEELERKVALLEEQLSERQLSQMLKGDSVESAKAREQLDEMILLIDHIISDVNNDRGEN